MGELTSEWGMLSPHLIASFFEVDLEGKRVNYDVTVKAPLTESSLEIALGWQSPFENSGNQVAPTLQQMLQAGAIEPIASKTDGLLGTSFSALVASLEGKTSVTKLNSTQIFMGMQPAKFNVTALFRAWKDPKKEVRDPFNQLMEWALPVQLASDGSILSRLAGQGVEGAMFPSQAPTLIAVTYKGCTYSPLVIESIVKDTNAPVDKDGNHVELAVPMALSTIAALDRQDWRGMQTRL